MNANLSRILDSCRNGDPVLMGILNVTPDSFSDGGSYIEPDLAVARAEKLIADGADIIDIGAESTRPGADRVEASEQLDRIKDVMPAVCAAADDVGAIVSIDTTRVQVAEFAVESGASIVNDVSAGRDDPDMLAFVAGNRCAVVLMHMLGEPATMQFNPEYSDVVSELNLFFEDRVRAAVDAGIDRDLCILDPGIGFGKRLRDNLDLISNLSRFLGQGLPLLVGPSRKRFIGDISSLGSETERLGGTIAACLECFRNGATIFRVHDVAPIRESLDVAALLAKNCSIHT